MDLIQEITADAQYPCHVYYANSNRTKIVGYVRVGTRKLQKFSRPLDFNVRGRKFQVIQKNLEPDSRYFGETAQPVKPDTETRTVAGSGGKTYTLTRTGTGWSCSYPGYQFRRKCRHVES